MIVTYRGSNKLADYYEVIDGPHRVTVRHGTNPERPFACMTHNKNACEHIDAVELHLSTASGPSGDEKTPAESESSTGASHTHTTSNAASDSA